MNARQIRQAIKISTNTSTIGFFGEDLAIQGLRNSGLHVQKTASLKNGFYADLFVNKKIRFEVKTAKQNKNGYFKICLKKSDKHGSTDIAHSDFVLVQLISNSGLLHILFIPSSELIGKKSLSLSIGKKSKYNKFISSYSEIAKKLPC